MSDFATHFDKRFLTGDWALESGDLKQDGGLITSVLISLFTDARAKSTDVPPDGSNNRRGYWAELLMDMPVGSFGSRLWLLHREIMSQEVLIRAREYASEALQWLIDQRIAEDVIVDAFEVLPRLPGRDAVLGLHVQIIRPKQPALTFRFNRLWSETLAA